MTDDESRGRRREPAWRRLFAYWLAIAAAGVAACGGGNPRPNVLLIVMDTTRADRCSVNGYRRPTTPRLEAFARDAVVFRDAWSPANWTGPAHATLFTGLRPVHHGFMRDNRTFLADDADTLAKRLAAAGYATACFSNNAAVAPEFGLTGGFEKFEPMFERRDRVVPWARETHAEAAAWAREQARAGRPFFLFINDMEAHLPYGPPRDVASRFVRGDAKPEQIAAAEAFGFPRFLAYDLGIEQLTDSERGLISDLYDAEVATLDEEIGRLLDGLRESGLLDSTLVVVTADHGENLGDHHLFEHSFGLHRTLCHVPLVMRLPGRFDKGRQVDDVVRLADVYPTVLEECGLPIPPGLDGESLERDVAGRVARSLQSSREDYRENIAALYGNADMSRLLRGISAVYDGRFHLLRYSDGQEELFDVKQDPEEAHDVRATSPDVASRLSALLDHR